MKFFLVLSFIFYQSFFSHFAQADTVKDSRLWLTYTAEHPLGEHWKITMQLQPYWREDGHDFDQITYRPGIYYHVNPKWMIGGGYAYAEGYQPNHQRTHEDRLWEDVNYQLDEIKLSKVSLRTRFEHRRFEHQGEVLHSLRQMIKVTTPLTNTLGVVISDEFYANLNETENAQRGRDQNRLFVGMSYRVIPTSTMEFGYLNQYVTRTGDDTENHILAISLSQTF